MFQKMKTDEYLPKHRLNSKVCLVSTHLIWKTFVKMVSSSPSFGAKKQKKMPTTKIQGTTTNTPENSHVWTPKIMEVNDSNDVPLWLKFGVIFLGEPNQLGSKWFSSVSRWWWCVFFNKNYPKIRGIYTPKSSIFDRENSIIFTIHFGGPSLFLGNTHGSTPWGSAHIRIGGLFKSARSQVSNFVPWGIPSQRGYIPNRGGRNGGVG